MPHYSDVAAQELLPWSTNPFFLLYLYILDSMLPKSIQLVQQTLQRSDRLLLEVILSCQLTGLPPASQKSNPLIQHYSPTYIPTITSLCHMNQPFQQPKTIAGMGWYDTNTAITQSPQSQTGPLLQLDEFHQVLWIHSCVLTYLKIK